MWCMDKTPVDNMVVDKTPAKIAGEDKMLSILWYWKDKSFRVLQAPICSPKMHRLMFLSPTAVPQLYVNTTGVKTFIDKHQNNLLQLH